MSLWGSRQVSEHIDRTASAILKMTREGKFPKPVEDHGPGPGYGYRWDEDEVRAWYRQNPRRVRRPGEPAPPCAQQGCTRDAISQGVCLLHYKRLYISRLPDAGDVARTPPTTPDGRLICEECGQAFASLGGHLKAHDMTGAEYKEAHNLPRRQPLVAPWVREQLSESATNRMGGEAWERFVAARNPEAAAGERTEDTFLAVAKAQRSRP